jgi:anaphase-promoting complex subunit 8
VAPTGMDTRLVRELRNSIKDCTNRGLAVAAKWYDCTWPFKCQIETSSSSRSSELYLSIPQHKRDALSDPRLAFLASTPARSRSPRPSLSFVSASPAVTAGLDIPGISEGYLTSSEQSAGQAREAELERSEEAFLLAAQSFVASKEFGRALHVLRNCQSLNARFLSIYCQFLVSPIAEFTGKQ